MATENEQEPLVSARASKYFPMSAAETGETLARAGVSKRARTTKQEPSVAKVEVEETLEDGDIGGLLTLEHEDPGYSYFWVSERDRARFARRPWEPVRWAPGCCRPRDYFGARGEGDEIKVNELTLFRMKKEDAEKLKERDWKRRQHQSVINAIGEGARRNAAEFGNHAGGFSASVRHV